jgi:uncharacterized protein (TIGR03067 family)
MRLPISFCFALLVATISLPALAADDAKPAPDTKVDFKPFEGTWKVVALEADGNKAPADALKGMSLTFNGSELTGTNPGVKTDEKATVKLDLTKSPKQIDLTVTEGPQKGKTVQGIFKFEKERLIICMRGPEAVEKGRPKEFATEADSGLGMLTLERDKK